MKNVLGVFFDSGPVVLFCGWQIGDGGLRVRRGVGGLSPCVEGSCRMLQ